MWALYFPKTKQHHSSELRSCGTQQVFVLSAYVYNEVKFKLVSLLFTFFTFLIRFDCCVTTFFTNVANHLLKKRENLMFTIAKLKYWVRLNYFPSDTNTILITITSSEVLLSHDGRQRVRYELLHVGCILSTVKVQSSHPPCFGTIGWLTTPAHLCSPWFQWSRLVSLL